MMALRGLIVGIGLSLLIAGCQAFPGVSSEKDSLAAAAADVAQIEELRRRAELAHSRNEYQQAAVLYQQLQQFEPQNLAFVIARAKNLRYAGQGAEAFRIISTAPPEADGAPLFLLEAGKVAVAADQPDAAEQYLGKLTAMAPSSWEAHAVLGIAYDIQGRYGVAKSSYIQALTLSPGNSVVLNNYALSRAQAGDIESAIKILESALMKKRGSVQIRQNLALFYGIRGDIDHAKALARMDLDDSAVDNNLSFFNRFQNNAAETQ